MTKFVYIRKMNLVLIMDNNEEKLRNPQYSSPARTWQLNK